MIKQDFICNETFIIIHELSHISAMKIISKILSHLLRSYLRKIKNEIVSIRTKYNYVSFLHMFTYKHTHTHVHFLYCTRVCMRRNLSNKDTIALVITETIC